MQDDDEPRVTFTPVGPKPAPLKRNEERRAQVREAVREALRTGSPQPVRDESGAVRFWVVRQTKALED